MPPAGKRAVLNLLDCGDTSPLSGWETSLPVPKRGRARALHRRTTVKPGHGKAIYGLGDAITGSRDSVAGHGVFIAGRGDAITKPGEAITGFRNAMVGQGVVIAGNEPRIYGVQAGSGRCGNSPEFHRIFVRWFGMWFRVG